MSKKFRSPWDEEEDKATGQGKGGDDINELLRKMKEHFDGFSRLVSGGGDNFSRYKKMAIMVAMATSVLWLSTGIYTVQPEEEGVVMRFGKYVRSSAPGLNYKFPTPIETLTKVSVTRTNKEEIGYRSSGTGSALTVEALRQNTVTDESQMLTTDENIVDINFDVQWKISDAKDYILNVRDAGKENTVKSVAESAMREVIGLAKVNDVLAEERSRIEQNAKHHMQEMLDNLKMGVSIISVQLRRVDPPKETIDAYRDVQNAKQDKEREINQATSYRNDIVPRARGESEKMLQEAEAYRQRVIADATGESSRFDAILDQYRLAKDVTRKKIYIETMEHIFSATDKIILDKSSNNLLPYLPIAPGSSNATNNK